jgi:hypothetical protein
MAEAQSQEPHRQARKKDYEGAREKGAQNYIETCVSEGRAKYELSSGEQGFEASWQGFKAYEVRWEDGAHFDAGDVAVLKETTSLGGYTGRELYVVVTSVTRGFGLPRGLCVFGWREFGRTG